MAAIPVLNGANAMEVAHEVDVAPGNMPIPIVQHPVQGFVTVHADLPPGGDAVHATPNDLLQIYHQEAHHYNEALHNWRMANPPERHNIDIKRIAEGRKSYADSRMHYMICNVINRTGPGMVTTEQIQGMIVGLEHGM